MVDANDRYLKVFELKSGFTIGVLPLPPYYLDPIDEIFPLKEIPKREIVLASGDVYEEEYKMPDEPPDSDDIDEYTLYYRTKTVVEHNAKQQENRHRAQKDYLLSMCVSILDGPVAVEDDSWTDKLTAIAPDKISIPKHKGQRRLMFIKHVVLCYTDEWREVMATATYQEVTETGIARALGKFRSDVVQSSTDSGAPEE